MPGLELERIAKRVPTVPGVYRYSLFFVRNGQQEKRHAMSYRVALLATVPIRYPRDQLVSGWLYTTRELDTLQLGKDHGPRVTTNLHIHYSNTPSRLTEASYHEVPPVCLWNSESL